MTPIFLDRTKKWHIQSEGVLSEEEFYTLQEAIEFIKGIRIMVGLWR